MDFELDLKSEDKEIFVQSSGNCTASRIKLS